MRKISYSLKNTKIIHVFLTVFFFLGTVLLGIWLDGVLSAEKQKVKMQIVHAKQELEGLRDFRQIYGDSEEYSIYLKIREDRLRKIKQKIPLEMNMDDFLHDLQKITNDADIILKEVSPKELVWGEEYGMQHIRLHCLGDYFSMRDFFYHLEQGTRFISLGSVQIKGNEQGQLDCQIEVILYSMRKKS